MIDLHSHILPGLDDGSSNLLESLNMAKTAVKEGITHLFATPHHLNGQYFNSKREILDSVIEFNNHLIRENILITVHPGQELRIHRELFASLEMNEILTLDNNGKYLLLELPSGEVPNYTREVVYELLLKEITPIIVHPERNLGFMEENHLLFDLINEGALTQLTSGSLLGHFGKKVKSFSGKIIEHNLAHFIATDAHNVVSRGFSLHESYEIITKKFGINRTFYFMDNAELLLSGQYIYKEDPVPIRKRILGIF
ncbi:tyrosine-protein phosphatase [Neobacillus niacini]|uniref:tyrosine-protein phosphatase n=1 Tax=Neobacillus niacini TaxID=86668 RepID=UPI0005EF6147|nr:CpsB/CapC family capsule biosynthesis tyrosine phosphatase [Neobacillus niacini]